MSFIAGQYTVQYDAATIGQINGGITIEHFTNKQLITGDNYGSTPQDAVYQGNEVFMEFVCMEFDQAKAKLAFWPFLDAASAATAYGTLGQVGQLDVGSSIVKAIILTVVTGTPAAGQPASITASRATLAEGFPVRMLFAPALREVPLRFRLYPDANGKFFVPVYS